MNVASLGLMDPQVPGVATISDADALRGLLEPVGECLLGRDYLRYKPGTSMVAALRLSSGPAFAYAVSAAARAKLAKTAKRAPAGALVAGSVSGGLLIARPGADRDLPGLADPGRLGRWLPDRSESGLTMLAYKPQRRWVGRTCGRGEVNARVVRLYRPRELSAALTGWRIAARSADQGLGLTVPRVLDRSDRYGVAVVSWLPGRPLDKLLADRSFGAGSSGSIRTRADEILPALGAGLARLHQSTRRACPGRPTGQLRAAESVAQELSAVLPAERGRVTAIVRHLSATAPWTRWIHPVHGDFSTDQVIVGPDGHLGLTDWDRAGWGDPAVDLGNLRAAGLPHDAYAAVVGGYRSLFEPPETTGWHLVAAEATRLTEPLRRCRAGWRLEVAERLTMLEDLLSRLGSRDAEPHESPAREGLAGGRAG